VAAGSRSDSERGLAGDAPGPNDDSTRARGRRVEARVREFLSARGVRVVETNFLRAGAEVDLIGELEDASEPTVIFVEVRSRSSDRSGHAMETVDAAKQRRIVRAATAYLVERDLWERVAVRFDVVTVTGDADDAPIEWLPAAFDAK
jgi:putative endonuclease